MQKLSETAAFARLVKLSREHLMRAEGGQQARAGEPYGGLFPCEIAADKAVQAPDRAGHAGNDEECWEGVGLAHSSHLLLWGAVANQGLKRNLALGECADSEHEFRGNTVVGHLCDPTRRDAEEAGKRLGSAAFCFKPRFEIHDASLDHSKPTSQEISKPPMFMLASTMDDLTQHRKKRLELLIASPPYNGDRMAFIGKAQLTKGRISQLLDPGEAFGERSAQALALRLGLHERWFEQGGIEAKPAWPFALLTPDDVRKLSSKALEMVERQALSLLDLETTGTVHKAQTDTVAPPKSEGFPGTQQKPEFMKAVSEKRSADPRTPRKTGNG